MAKQTAEKSAKDTTIPYFPEAKATCACGAVHTVGSTREEIFIEICSKCHPLYTGVRKLIDEGGRVGRFQKMSEQSKAKASTTTGKKARVAKRATIKAKKTPKIEKE